MGPLELYKLALEVCGVNSTTSLGLVMNLAYNIKKRVAEKGEKKRDEISREIVGTAIFHLCQGFLCDMREGDEQSPEFCLHQLAIKFSKLVPPEIQEAERPPLSVDMSQLYTLGISPEDLPYSVNVD